MLTRSSNQARRYPAGLAPLRGCLADRSGAAAIMIALLLVPILGAMGLAVDASVAFMVESRLSKSLDSAALAAGRMADTEEAEQIALSYFAANLGNSLPDLTIDDISFVYDADTRTVSMDVRASVQTHFAQLFGIETISVGATTVVERVINGMELALVLDITGSMRGSKFTAMRDAALVLVDTLYGEETEIDNLYISLVPYVASVNIGSMRADWLKPEDLAIAEPERWNADPLGWKGCVEARAFPHDTKDTPPGEEPFTSYLYENTSDTNDNNFPPVKGEHVHSNDARGPNLGCGAPITPLTNSRTAIEAGINAMQAWARGGTAGNLGLSWGWRTISPRWRGLWGLGTPANYPLDYGAEFMSKAVVILTDGQNQFYDHSHLAGSPYSDYTAYGRLEDADKLHETSLNEGRKILDARMRETCAAMDAAGIMIYTITFGTGVDATAQQLFRSCASEASMYYHAPSNGELEGIFQEIAGQLSALRITE